MEHWLTRLVVLGQDPAGAAPAGAAPAAGEGQGPSSLVSMLIMFGPIVVFMVVIMWTSGRQQSREQTKRMTMIKSLKKNDPVVTIGGIMGTVVSVSEDGAEVTLKMVDDTRIKFRSDAIRDVLTRPDSGPPKTA